MGWTSKVLQLLGLDENDYGIKFPDEDELEEEDPVLF